MDAEFWHDKWQRNEIAFHESQVHPMLANHLSALNLPQNSRVFLPLCGKTLDIAWLLNTGYRVAGAELSDIAIRDLFSALNLHPEIREAGALKHYQAPGIDIFSGDIFALDAGTLGAVDAVYDRAALVALPTITRREYAAHLLALTATAPQLLITFEYDQTQMVGPPFSVDAAEVNALYGADCQLSVIERKAVEGGLKGRTAATEILWLLQKHRK